jgi:translocator protein
MSFFRRCTQIRADFRKAARFTESPRRCKKDESEVLTLCPQTAADSKVAHQLAASYSWEFDLPGFSMHTSFIHQVLGLAGWIFLSFTAASIGAFGSRNAGGFYQELIRPSWAPPGWLFGPVWSVLYLSMGVAAWLVWRSRGWAGARGALSLFLVQLAANALWSWLFFEWRLGAVSFIEILLLWILILATILAFWRIRPLAGALLLPYIAWVSFAAALNYTLWQLNPALQS